MQGAVSAVASSANALGGGASPRVSPSRSASCTELSALLRLPPLPNANHVLVTRMSWDRAMSCTSALVQGCKHA